VSPVLYGPRTGPATPGLLGSGTVVVCAGGGGAPAIRNLDGDPEGPVAEAAGDLWALDKAAKIAPRHLGYRPSSPESPGEIWPASSKLCWTPTWLPIPSSAVNFPIATSEPWRLWRGNHEYPAVDVVRGD
jgi:hypothetical protein